MARICEVCGRVEEVEEAVHPYDILDVCPACTEQVIHRTPELE
ncbi:hypothetical protein [Terrihalobacillus insolitus]|nr:hypothetical protein [Terrihalobacillus insolitus]